MIINKLVIDITQLHKMLIIAEIEKRHKIQFQIFNNKQLCKRCIDSYKNNKQSRLMTR